LELLDYWSENPPEHIMLQVLAKYRPRKRKRMIEGDLDAANLVVDSTITNEASLPPWVREVREIERQRKAGTEKSQ